MPGYFALLARKPLTMRNLILIITLFTFAIGCKKDSDTIAMNPDLTVGLTGIYPLTLYREGSQSINLPSNGVSGQFEMTRIDMTHLRGRLTITDMGITEEYSTNEFELKRNAARFDISVDGQSVGSMSATDIDVTATSPDGTVNQIKAKR